MPVPAELWRDLDLRLQRIPRQRVRRWADYWALVAVERDHVGVLGRRFALSDQRRNELERWWMLQIETLFSDRQLQWRTDQRHRVLRRMRTVPSGGRLSTAWFQVRFNTVGPGGRCWLANRYTTIRHHTFRLYWRP